MQHINSLDTLHALRDRIIADASAGDALRSETNEIYAPGAFLTRQEALDLLSYPDLDELCDAADMIARTCSASKIDSCSIVNARSGLCGENCKWCAQSVHYNTGCDKYEFIDTASVMKCARHNEEAGIKRFSLVTSGRHLSDSDLEKACDIYSRLSAETDLYLCASMGLLTPDQLKRLSQAGVKRYHCNMETASDYFGTLCTTHTPQDKIETIRAARKAGMEICSGGIIGMGETPEHRVQFAFELAELGVDSVPMNILSPIKGTPLEDTPLIAEQDVVRCAAIWRFILPRQVIRFAGGRMRLSHDMMLRMLRGGVNGALMGDMLTTVSNTIAADRKLFAEAGL